jgi:hypothetical protein
VPKKKRSLSPSNTPDYEEFLRSVKLYSLALNEMSAKLDRDMYWGLRKKSDSLIREIETDYKPVDVKEDHFDIEAKLVLTIAPKLTKSTILRIACTYSAHFHASVGCSGQAAERFAESEARIIIWPYFRQLVSDVTGRMYIPPITIPLALD